ncbi:MAG TPA: efflux RND transporter periplasmic adaptor subunit [Caulobacteraceae bacterium]|nr:efflux RND transporter periplasmic adaptor subunit [Caulobacteraceae bacterium]
MRVWTRAASLGLMLAAGLPLAACDGGHAAAPPSAQQTGARVVRVATIAMRPLTGGLESSGILVSREEASVFAEQLLGGYRVLKVFVEPDATVGQGQPLVQLDDTLLRAQIAQARAQAAQQRVAAEQADQQAADVEGLDKQGVLSKEQIDQRRFAAKSAHAALAASLAQLHDLETRDSRMIIRAPVAGLVLTRNVRPGDIASGGANPMFTLARDSLVELNAQVAEGDMAGIHVGDAVQVTLPDGTSIQGSVRLIEPSIDPNTKLGKVHIRLPVRTDLRPGGFGRASFTGLTRTAAAVPEAAIRYDADGASVMVVGADNRVRQVPVKTGEHEGGFVEIVSGPPAGSRVLLGASAFVLPGDLVRPIQDTTTAER